MKPLKSVYIFISLTLFFHLNFAVSLYSQEIVLARLKYAGGGDWYNDPEIIPNLAKELKEWAGLKVKEEQKIVSLLDEDLFNYPFLFITGHGNIRFSDEEITRLRKFLTAGGFLYADDDYGMDEAFRREIKKVFPQAELLELPFEHPIYHCFYNFPQGLPKIHEHYPGAPHGYGIFYEGRLVVFYTYNSNITDGWTPAHNDPPEKRESAFKMGTNIIWYVLTQ
ncbi:MAG: DUF4159 domain-containing protein [Candidatus Edwardsbacteria bacterium]